MRKYLLILGFWFMGAMGAFAAPGALEFDESSARASSEPQPNSSLEPLTRAAEGEPEIAVQSQQVITNISSLNEVEQPLTTAEGLLVQQPAPSPAAPAQVTGVQLKPTDQGLEVILETTSEFAEVLNSETENSLITDIPNAQLRLPKGGAFRQDNPTQDIAAVEVTNLDAKTIRVTVTGKAGVPTAEVSQSPEALILSVAAPSALAPPPAPTTPPPATPAPAPEQQTPPPAAPQPEPQAEEEILELDLRAEEEEGNYNVPDATTATRTDTPIQNVPASIQVIPRQVIEDQGDTSLGETLRNASGVTVGRTSAASRATTPLIRGFETDNILRNGLRDDTLRLSSGITNIERIEILKGPASVLFGSGNLGGTINLITEVPLFEPRYEAKFTVGNNAFYQPLIDLTGPIAGGTAYRLNVAYESRDSFQNFENGDFFFIAPVLQVINTEQTSLIVDLEYLSTRTRRTAPQLPAVSAIGVEGNTLIDEIIAGGGQIPAEQLQAAGTLDIRSNLGEPEISRSETNSTRVGYRFQHEFNDIWTIRNEFLGSFQDTPQDSSVVGVGFVQTGGQPDLNLLNRVYIDNPSSRDVYTLNTNIVGDFEIAGIDQTLLLGFEWSQENQQDKIFQRLFLPFLSPDAEPFNIFDPNYDSSRFFNGSDLNERIGSDSSTRSRTIGLYGQTQLNFLDERLIVVLGGRFDFADQWFQDLANRADPSPIESSDTAFSPRVGVVVKPIENVSLYGSYTESFNPTIGLSAGGEVFSPETGNQFEVGLKANFLDDRLSTTLAYYRLRRNNVLTQAPNNPGFQVQVGEQASDGVEFDLTGEILPGWNIIANYAYTNARILEDNEFPSGRELLNVPEHAAGLWTTYEIQSGNLEGLGFGLGIYFQGERNGDLRTPFVLPSFTRTDASIFYRRGQFRTQLNFQNLFDTRYFEGARDQFRVTPGAPFTVLASVQWEF